MSQINQDKMYKLGVAMDEYRKFYWIGICLFFLIIPLFILAWKYIKFIIALNDVRQTSLENENLKYGFFGLVVALAIPFATAAFSSITEISYIFSIIQIVSLIFGWIKLELWSENLHKERNTGNMAQFNEGMKDIKMAQILTLLIIGIFMIPGAFGKAGGALIREFGQGGQTTQQPQYVQTQQPQYAQTQQPQYGQPQQPPTQSPVGPFVCPQCGVQLKDKNIKFCGTCGFKF